MTNYARILDNHVVEVSTDPDNCFHPLIAKEFVVVPDFVQPGFMKNGDQWIDPKKPIEEEF